MSLPLRSKIEHRSVPIIEWLNGLPRVVPFLALLALMVAGAFVPTVGFVFTLVVAAFISWLLFLTWPRLTLPEKLLRVTVLVMVAAVALMQAFPRAI